MDHIDDTPRLDILHIMPGYYCNFFCSHCLNDSGPKQQTRLSDAEIAQIQGVIHRYRPKQLLFTGGEPTFFIPTINTIMASHPALSSCVVRVTTNGWFAKDLQSIAQVLGAFTKLDHLQCSFDTFHGSSVRAEHLRNLAVYCRRHQIRFNVSVCISDPRDLIAASRLQQEVDAQVTFQKVDASGRARTRHKAFKYFTFEREVLEKRCPNVGQMNYICQKGFTLCCSNLIFNGSVPSIAHASLEEHVQSAFYQEMSTSTFGDMLKRRGLSAEQLRPEHSSPYGLCEYLHAADMRATG